MNMFKVPDLNEKTSKNHQQKLRAAIEGVDGVESVALRLSTNEFEIRARPDEYPKRDDLAAAAARAGFPLEADMPSQPDSDA